MCVLGYEDFADYLDCCLSSVSAYCDDKCVKEVRIGLNSPSKSVRAVAEAAAAHWPCTVRIFTSTPQFGKYPMMRRMFYEEALSSSHIMWLDDDCRIRAGGAGFLPHMLDRIGTAPVMGRRFERSLSSQQRAAITRQPWYRGIALPYGYSVSFPNGGWWMAQTRFLQEFDWPPRQLRQRGGDWLLGELLRQQQLPWVNYSNGVRINAMPKMPDGSALPRGWTVTTPDWGMDED